MVEHALLLRDITKDITTHVLSLAQVHVSSTAGLAGRSFTYAESYVKETGKDTTQETVILLYLPLEQRYDKRLYHQDSFPRREVRRLATGAFHHCQNQVPQDA